MVQINDAVFLNDFQVSLLFVIDHPLFMLLDALLMCLLFHFFFGELLLMLSNVKRFLVAPVFTVFLDLLVSVFLVILIGQSHGMFALLFASFDTVIQTSDLHKEIFALIVQFLEMFVLLYDCDHLFKLLMEFLLIPGVFVLLDHMVVLSFVSIYFILMELLSQDSTIQHLIDTQFILEILD